MSSSQNIGPGTNLVEEQMLGAWLATIEMLTGAVVLFGPAIASGNVAAMSEVSVDRAAEFVVGMLGVALTMIVRNRSPILDDQRGHDDQSGWESPD